MFNSQTHSVPNSILPHRDTESEFSEWFEVDSNGMDCIANTPTSSTYQVTNSNCSISFFDEMYNKSKNSDKEKKNADQRHNNLIVENENLNYKLANEKQKCEVLERKLQFIQENQETINRIKQSYLSTKYNKSIGMPILEVKEQACQTWHGIICASCIETAEMKRAIDKIQAEKSNDFPLVVVKRSELAKLYDTVAALQNMIHKREKSWSLNADREEKYKNTISDLKNKLELLETLITKSHERLQAVNVETDLTLGKAEKENVFLRKIIIKMEKRQRGLEKTYNIKKQQPFALSVLEKEMVQELIRKYSDKVKMKFLESMRQENATQLSHIYRREKSGGDRGEKFSPVL